MNVQRARVKLLSVTKGLTVAGLSLRFGQGDRLLAPF